MLVLWLLGQAILPFIIGAGVAYLLDPLADRLERAGLSRTWAVVTITLGAVLVFVAFLLFLAPIVIRQAAQLVAAPDPMVAKPKLCVFVYTKATVFCCLGLSIRTIDH